MTGSYTRTASGTFTITDARYVGGRVGADLRQLYNLYGKPGLDSIEDYAEEVAILLNRGLLDTVDYGFRDTANNTWKMRLRYKATVGGQLIDSRPGSFPDPVDLTGYAFYSFLTYSPVFSLLTSSEKTGLNLPFSRTTGTAPSALAGTTTAGHGYARNGTGVARDIYVAR